jgi:hypothetical protein
VIYAQKINVAHCHEVTTWNKNTLEEKLPKLGALSRVMSTIVTNQINDTMGWASNTHKDEKKCLKMLVGS